MSSEPNERVDLIPIPVEHNGNEWLLYRSDGAPMVKDLDVARWLGFERLREFRRLIERHLESLGEVSRYRDAKPPSPSGGRPGAGYLLREEQALYLAAKSETPNARQVLKAMIVVFMEARRPVIESREFGPQESLVHLRRSAVLALLSIPAWARRSDNAVAKALHMSPTTVAKVRALLPNPPPGARLGLDDRTIDTANIGSSPKPRPELEMLEGLQRRVDDLAAAQNETLAGVRALVGSALTGAERLAALAPHAKPA